MEATKGTARNVYFSFFHAAGKIIFEGVFIFRVIVEIKLFMELSSILPDQIASVRCLYYLFISLLSCIAEFLLSNSNFEFSPSCFYFKAQALSCTMLVC